MSPDNYELFSRLLVERAAADENVLGVVFLGSAATAERRDEWSDHDFFLIVRAGLQEHYRQDLSWLPDREQVTMHYRETAHGLTVIYSYGHLIEFAVFDLAEMDEIKANDYAVLLDRADIAHKMQAAAARTHPETVDIAAATRHLMQITFAGVGRWARGESISAHAFVRMYALRRLLQMLPLVLRPSNLDKLDSLDPYRRFEQVLPERGAEIEALLRSDIPECALGYLDLLERDVQPHLGAAYPTTTAEVLRRHIAKAQAHRRG